MQKILRAFLYALKGSVRDLTPIVLVIIIFQLVIIRAPIPDALNLVIGMCLVAVGLSLFIMGLEMGLFPIGESLAQALASKGSLFWLLTFAFALGFGTTVAEPALIAVADKAAEVAADAEAINNTPEAREEYANGLRMTVALSVGTAIVIGVLRILRGWPLHWIIIGGYTVVILLTSIAPEEIIGIAYDSGGVTTSTITVPLVTALGVGLATVIRGRNPVIDGFGLIAFASLLPMIFVMLYGMTI
jgi:hypothetical protein